MTMLSQRGDISVLGDRLQQTPAVTAELMAAVVGATCRRPVRPTEKTIRIERLIVSCAWTDVALALIDLELPQWQVRRIAYDDGEWHCALSRRRELPEWLDQSIETRHADLPLALLSAFVEAKRASAPRSRTSVPLVPQETGLRCLPVCCDNFAR
jgi:hypothetical protein